MKTALEMHLKEVQKYPTLTPRQEKELALKIMLGNTEAREQLILGNMRYVISKAIEYSEQGVPLEDLISEGYVGLCKAVDKYDPLKGYKFITFASWWIWQSIISFLTNNIGTVRIPVNKVSDIAKIRKMEEQLSNELGRTPTVEELEEALPGMCIAKLAPWMNISYLRTIPRNEDKDPNAMTEQEEIDLLAKASGIPFPQPDDDLVAKSLLKEIDGALNRLSEREQAIIRMYYGLDELTPMTLEEIGDLYGLTRERIRQIKNSALGKLENMGTLKNVM